MMNMTPIVTKMKKTTMMTAITMYDVDDDDDGGGDDDILTRGLAHCDTIFW